MTHVHWISNRDELETIASEWNSLSPAWPTQRFEWLSAAWDAYANEGSLCWGVVRSGTGKLIGGIPLFRSRTIVHGRLLSLVGSGRVCSDGAGVTAEPGQEDAVVAALANALLGTSSSAEQLAWDELDWDGVAANDSTTQQLIDALTTGSAEGLECGVMSTWQVELASRGAKKLNDVVSRSARRKIRRLEERARHPDISYHEARNQNEFEIAQDFAIELHQARQRSVGHPGCFADPRFEQFYREASGRLFAKGLWRLYWVSAAGKPISFFTGAFIDNVQYTYQTGMDPSAIEWEPGWLAQLRLVEQGLSEGWRAINFMRGDHDYKRFLGAEPTACRRVRICHPRLSSQGRFKLFQLARNVKHWWDSVPSTLPSVPISSTHQGHAS